MSRCVDPAREDGWSLGSIVGDVHGVEPEGVAVPLLPVGVEDHRTETAAQTFPCRGSGVVFGEDPLHNRASTCQHLIHQERQQHHCGESVRQVLGSVSEVVFQQSAPQIMCKCRNFP